MYFEAKHRGNAVLSASCSKKPFCGNGPHSFELRVDVVSRE
jgi:hypothetical protein